MHNSPVEWKSRNVARINVDLPDNIEICNVITNVNRISGQLITNNELVDIDRIEIAFDINTFQGNKDTRFTADNIEPFFRKSLGIREEILEQLRIKLNV